MKMGKSLGNTLEPNQLVQRFEPDAVGYFFLREVEFGNDGDYSEERFINIINADLANTIGHQRTQLNAPKHWILDKLGGAFVSHIFISSSFAYSFDLSDNQVLFNRIISHYQGLINLRECLSLILILRNQLKYALTYREVQSILMQRHVIVDNKIRSDKTYPAGFMGVVSIPKTNESFGFLYDTKGRFRLHSTRDEELKHVPSSVWNRLVAGLNAQLRTVRSGSTRYSLVPVINWIKTHGNPQLDFHGVKIELSWFQATGSGFYQLGILATVLDDSFHNLHHPDLVENNEESSR
ncbi:putative ribosomal protein S4e [Helianthus anomalus]